MTVEDRDLATTKRGGQGDLDPRAQVVFDLLDHRPDVVDEEAAGFPAFDPNPGVGDVEIVAVGCDSQAAGEPLGQRARRCHQPGISPQRVLDDADIASGIARTVELETMVATRIVAAG